MQICDFTKPLMANSNSDEKPIVKLDSLPEDILLHIFSFLTAPKDVATIRMLCKWFRWLSGNDIWSHNFLKLRTLKTAEKIFQSIYPSGSDSLILNETHIGFLRFVKNGLHTPNIFNKNTKQILIGDELREEHKLLTQKINLNKNSFWFWPKSSKETQLKTLEAEKLLLDAELKTVDTLDKLSTHYIKINEQIEKMLLFDFKRILYKNHQTKQMVVLLSSLEYLALNQVLGRETTNLGAYKNIILVNHLSEPLFIGLEQFRKITPEQISVSVYEESLLVAYRNPQSENELFINSYSLQSGALLSKLACPLTNHSGSIKIEVSEKWVVVSNGNRMQLHRRDDLSIAKSWWEINNTSPEVIKLHDNRLIVLTNNGHILIWRISENLGKGLRVDYERDIDLNAYKEKGWWSRLRIDRSSDGHSCIVILNDYDPATTGNFRVGHSSLYVFDLSTGILGNVFRGLMDEFWFSQNNETILTRERFNNLETFSIFK